MKKTITSVLTTSLLCLGMSVSTLSHGQILPSDPQTTKCSLTSSEFRSWFGLAPNSEIALSPNAVAKPANSVGFPLDNTRCDFYKWSSQMFLWLASPSGQDYVFDSLNFFDVSPKIDGIRKLIPNTPNTPNNFATRSSKGDETLTEEIGETGQAGGQGVLISESGSIVYYGIHVNDVYAYFLSFAKNQTPPLLTDFPDNQIDLDVVELYADTQNVKLTNPEALTMELKTSWVDATTVNDKSQYLTITATVPDYVKKSDTLWKLKGTTTKELAMVGMHIVGTVQNHPEMVWATVEHFNNAPDASYYYTNANGDDVLLAGVASGPWTFSEQNLERASVCTQSNQQGGNLVNCSSSRDYGNISATNGNTIGTTSVVRVNPWGNAGVPASPISQHIQDPGNNAQLISLARDVVDFLPAGDVRRNYFVSGAVWTQNGNIPTYSSGGPAFTQVGSLSLANTTMETFHQEIATSATTAEAGCFMCHSISGDQAAAKQGVEVSHIYDEIQAIPPLLPILTPPVQ